MFLVMVPNWILVINIIAGIIGSIVSIGILKQKIKPFYKYNNYFYYLSFYFWFGVLFNPLVLYNLLVY